MGLFGKVFDKKECAICGGEIGLLGNRKLEDGNMCKNCAAQLSPWFDERRHSTVAQIQDQLAYREANKQAVEAFQVTRSMGDNDHVLIDEDAGKFLVCKTSNYRNENPDVLDLSQVTGCDLDINESRTEEKRKDKDGKMVSYNPPRYQYRYDFYVVIQVRHDFFDDMKCKLNNSSISVNQHNRTGGGFQLMNAVSQVAGNAEYTRYEQMGIEIKQALMEARSQSREASAAANAPKIAKTCPWCGATTMPDSNGCCEYCGGAMES